MAATDGSGFVPPQLTTVTSGRAQSVVYQLNPNPGFWRRILSFEVVEVTCLAGVFLGVAIFSTLQPASVGGRSGAEFFLGLFIAWTVFSVVVVVANYAWYRRVTPDQIRIERDKIVGIYGRHLLGPHENETRWIPLSPRTHLRESRGRFVGGYFPAEIIGERADLTGFNPSGVLELLRGPAVPSGRVRYFFVTDENLRVVQAASEEWFGVTTGTPDVGRG
jgi:hypothetical protein